MRHHPLLHTPAFSFSFISVFKEETVWPVLRQNDSQLSHLLVLPFFSTPPPPFFFIRSCLDSTRDVEAGESGIQTHPWLYIEFETNLSCMKLYLKKKKKKPLPLPQMSKMYKFPLLY